MGKSDATGHKRGAGVYSRSYPKLADPPMPRAAREIYGDVSVTAADNRGFASPVKQSGRSAKSTAKPDNDSDGD